MEIIIGYFVKAIKAILTALGVEFDASGLEAIFGEIKDFEPKTEKDSFDL